MIKTLKKDEKNLRAVRDFLLQKVTPEEGIEPETIIILPKTSADCVYFDGFSTGKTLGEVLNDIHINEQALDGKIIIKDGVVAINSTYSSKKIEEMIAAIDKNTTIDGLQFSVENGNLVVTYDDGRVE